MAIFDRNDREFIRHVVRDMQSGARIGRVVQVYEHTKDDDESNFEADVRFTEEENLEHRVAPITQEHGDSIAIPRVGDKVVVNYMYGDKQVPVITDVVNTNKQRAVKGEVGMRRTKVRADQSATGDGDIYVTSHTQYDQNPALEDYQEIAPERAFFRVAKKDNALDGLEQGIPMRIEMLDTVAGKAKVGETQAGKNATDASRISLGGDRVDNDTNMSMDATLDFKEGLTRLFAEDTGDSEELDVELDIVNGVVDVTATDTASGDTYTLTIDIKNETAELSGDGTNTMGVKFDFSTDEFTIIDGSGYGIESDGAGNFTWHYETIDHSQGTTTSL